MTHKMLWRDRLRPRTLAESGQALVEYALVVAVIAMALIAAMSFLRSAIAQLFSDVAGGF